MTTEHWQELTDYLGGGEAATGQVERLQASVEGVLHGYRTIRHNRWRDLQDHVKQVNYYNSAHGMDYVNRLTDEFVAEYGTYDASQ